MLLAGRPGRPSLATPPLLLVYHTPSPPPPVPHNSARRDETLDVRRPDRCPGPPPGAGPPRRRRTGRGSAIDRSGSSCTSRGRRQGAPTAGASPPRRPWRARPPLAQTKATRPAGLPAPACIHARSSVELAEAVGWCSTTARCLRPSGRVGNGGAGHGAPSYTTCCEDPVEEVTRVFGGLGLAAESSRLCSPDSSGNEAWESRPAGVRCAAALWSPAPGPPPHRRR